MLNGIGLSGIKNRTILVANWPRFARLKDRTEPWDLTRESRREAGKDMFRGVGEGSRLFDEFFAR